jgi:Domain of unknown function (DUF4407)
VGRFLIWLSGADREILAQCPTERAKYVGIGSAILITAAMAAVSMTFALYGALKLSLPIAIPFAVAWGLAIMSLDRWLVVSLQRSDNKWDYLILALPRVALGILFGLIISTPITLQIFKPEIDQQITVIQTQRLNTYLTHLKTDSLSKRINDERTTVNNLLYIINSGGGAGLNPAQNGSIQTLVKERDQAQQLATAYYNRWQCQRAGVPTVACKMGHGLAWADHQRYNEEQALVNQDNTQIQQLTHQILIANPAVKARNLANARAALPAAQQALETDLSAQQRQTASFRQQNSNNAGLLLRLEALDQVAAGSGMLNTARWLLFLFFTIIECLPILVKVLLNLLPENNYDRVLAMEERKQLRLAKEWVQNRQAEGIIEAGDLHTAWEAALPEITQERLAAKRSRVLVEVQAEKARRVPDTFRAWVRVFRLPGGSLRRGPRNWPTWSSSRSRDTKARDSVQRTEYSPNGMRRDNPTATPAPDQGVADV